MISYIYINRDNVVDNAKDGGDRPVITVLQGNEAKDYAGVQVMGPSRIVYRKDGTLKKGYETRVWVETESELRYE